MAINVLFIAGNGPIAGKTTEISTSYPEVRVAAPTIPMDDEPPLGRDIGPTVYLLSEDGVPSVTPDNRRLFVIRNWDTTIWNGDRTRKPNMLRVSDDGQTIELFWSEDRLRWRAHRERRFLRQNQLLKPLHISIGGATQIVKRPSRISVNDHHQPGLDHLRRLLDLSAGDYEAQAPLLNLEGGGTAKPTQAELRTIIDAELADHKLAHEKSAATEAEVERLYAGATAELPAETDAGYADAFANRNGFIAILRAFNTETYWDSAPPKKPLFPVIQTPPSSA